MIYPSGLTGNIGNLLRLIQEEKTSSIANLPPATEAGSPMRGLIQQPLMNPNDPGSARQVSLRPEGVTQMGPAGTPQVVGPIANIMPQRSMMGPPGGMGGPTGQPSSGGITTPAPTVSAPTTSQPAVSSAPPSPFSSPPIVSDLGPIKTPNVPNDVYKGMVLGTQTYGQAQAAVEAANRASAAKLEQQKSTPVSQSTPWWKQSPFQFLSTKIR
jgi:hypothetical protein